MEAVASRAAVGLVPTQGVRQNRYRRARGIAVGACLAALLGSQPAFADAGTPYGCAQNTANYISAYTQLSADDYRARATVQIIANGVSCTGTLLASAAGPTDQRLRIATASHCAQAFVANAAVGSRFPATLYWDAVGNAGTTYDYQAANPSQSLALTIGALGGGTVNGNDFALLVADASTVVPATAYFSAWDASPDAILQGASSTSLGFPAFNAGTSSAYIPPMQWLSEYWTGAWTQQPPGDEYTVARGCSSAGDSGSPVFRDADLYDVGLDVGAISYGTTSYDFVVALTNLRRAASAYLDPQGSGATLVSGYPAASGAGLPNLNFSATPDTVAPGQNAVLSWSASGAQSCTASGGWSSALPTAGSQQVTPAATTTYRLTCSNAAGSVARAVTIEVPGTAAAGKGGAVAPSLLLALALLALTRRPSSRRPPT